MHSTKRIDELSRREFQVNRLEAQLASTHELLEHQAQYKCESSPVEQDELIDTLTTELEEMREQHKVAVAAADREAEMQKVQARQAIEAAVAEVSLSFAPTLRDQFEWLTQTITSGLLVTLHCVEIAPASLVA